MADNEEQVKDDGLPLQPVLDDLADQKVRFSIAIIDACRDNPFPSTAGRCSGVLSAGGRQVTSTCTDSVFGQLETVLVRQ